MKEQARTTRSEQEGDKRKKNKRKISIGWVRCANPHSRSLYLVFKEEREGLVGVERATNGVEEALEQLRVRARALRRREPDGLFGERLERPGGGHLWRGLVGRSHRAAL